MKSNQSSPIDLMFWLFHDGSCKENKNKKSVKVITEIYIAFRRVFNLS